MLLDVKVCDDLSCRCEAVACAALVCMRSFDRLYVQTVPESFAKSARSYFHRLMRSLPRAVNDPSGMALSSDMSHKMSHKIVHECDAVTVQHPPLGLRVISRTNPRQRRDASGTMSMHATCLVNCTCGTRRRRVIPGFVLSVQQVCNAHACNFPLKTCRTSRKFACKSATLLATLRLIAADRWELLHR